MSKISVVQKMLAASLVSLFSISTLASDCVELQGTAQQGGLIWGSVAPGTTVRLGNEQLDVLDDGTFFAGLGRDAPAVLELLLEGAAGSCEQSLSVAARDYDIQRIEGVPQRTVTPPKAQQARIKREAEIVAAAKAQRLFRSDLLLAALDGFDWPVIGRISGVYGSQRVYNGVPRSPHYGVDVAVPTGTIVRAPAAGVVTLAEPDLFYSGGTIILDHGYQLSSSFLHLSKLHVALGDEVQPGEVIAEVGATGRATGPHLDWRMSWRKQRIDPQLLVSPMPATAKGQ
ncbi:M23 family metallopeptidase [Parahaliea sp. F7430]|uniref:M23 family metallopeptidase n=1 Tax=Sediminihaliea albiluteola TaxID=2758564 RepID=A0A7W2TTU3_9GAMM|nr:M23 family metallopeptidase [Sediminihaliea albiluteola]MBA6411748.1 M23 family metallopeptidase [Sediminihaliea albiluteola]